MRKKVIITGATGFVGSNLVEHLLNKNYEIYVILRENSIATNLTNINIFRYDGKIEPLIAYFKKINPTVIFHLASNFVAEHEYNQVDSLINSNILFGTHILEAMRLSGVKKLINTGTFWQHYKNQDYNPVCLYAATKQAFETLAEYYVQAEGFKIITLKLSDTYGETDKRPKLINLLNKFANEGTVLNLSPGNQELSLVHIKDVCKAYDIACDLISEIEYVGHNSFAIEADANYKLIDIIQLFEEVTKKNINVNWGGREYRKREVMSLWKNGIRLPRWSPEISLEQGLKRYIS